MKLAKCSVILAVAALFCAPALAADTPDYIGAEKCKMCHKVEYTSWLETGHAKAFDRLKPEEQGKPECLSCHATGKRADLPGVQCESCHGPGSLYKSMTVMKDHAASVAAGLIVPTEETCLGCHAKGKAPHEVSDFAYEEAKKKGLHAKKE